MIFNNFLNKKFFQPIPSCFPIETLLLMLINHSNALANFSESLTGTTRPVTFALVSRHPGTSVVTTALLAAAASIKLWANPLYKTANTQCVIYDIILVCRHNDLKFQHNLLL